MYSFTSRKSFLQSKNARVTAAKGRGKEKKKGKNRKRNVDVLYLLNNSSDADLQPK